ncbi:MAG: hypothetical protein KKD17_01340 [Nanoarchaeota archaeon]|nr:hypothetical protein [Nanoarchaeota archaeon]
MNDFVFPKGNEPEFIEIAEKLGIASLCFVYDTPKDISEFQKKTRVKLSTAILCKPEDVKKYKGKFLTIVRAPDDQMQLRHIIEKIRPDILFNLEFHRRKDFLHHRASGLNHILAVLAKEKGVAIGFNFSALVSASPRDRALFLGRMMQNIVFARKFKFRTVIASFAESPWQMRAGQELGSFFVGLGMAAVEVHTALEGVAR